jgi:hypothetical protein
LFRYNHASFTQVTWQPYDKWSAAENIREQITVAGAVQDNCKGTAFVSKLPYKNALAICYFFTPRLWPYILPTIFHNIDFTDGQEISYFCHGKFYYRIHKIANETHPQPDKPIPLLLIMSVSTNVSDMLYQSMRSSGLTFCFIFGGIRL